MSAAIWLSLKLAAITTVLLLLICVPISYWLANSNSRWRVLVDAVIALPMVLPPTVIGFYLLLFFSPNGWLGQSWQWLFGESLAFSFSALVIGSLCYSIPFAVQPLKQGFSGIPKSYRAQANNLGLRPWQKIRFVYWPLLLPSVCIAATMVFAHTIGEFGVVLMIGGNIPGETKVVAIELFELVELMQYQQAHYLALGLLISAVAMLIPVYAIWGRKHD